MIGERRATLLLLVINCILVAIPDVNITMAESKTIIVPDDFATIQGAIDNANEGDTIFVKKGTYEGPINETLIIDKTISLIGEESTILNLHPLLLNKTIYYYSQYPTYSLFYDTSLIVESNNVTISGFTIKVPSPGGDIYVIGDGIQITDCIINTEIL